MSDKDILDMYGRDSSQPQRPRATNGGQMEPKDLPYSPPQGPKGQYEKKMPNNHGCCGTQGKH